MMFSVLFVSLSHLPFVPFNYLSLSNYSIIFACTTFQLCHRHFVRSSAYSTAQPLKPISESPTHATQETEALDFSFNPQYEPDFRWYDQTLLEAVKADDEHVHNFFRLLAICHTVMPELRDGRLEYQAQSPDESALVSAARNFGFVFRSRTPNTITIEVRGRAEEYELLSILDFNNVRKRMSVILRRHGKLVLYCKGADNVIYDRLGHNQYDIKMRTQEHLNVSVGWRAIANYALNAFS